MRALNLTAADPLALRLAADVRLGPTDYVNDHIWEVVLAGGEPAALAVRTPTPAQNMRRTRHTEGERTVTDPAAYAEPPVWPFRTTCAWRARRCRGWRLTEYWVPDCTRSSASTPHQHHRRARARSPSRSPAS
jgi:hypothetical protein